MPPRPLELPPGVLALADGGPAWAAFTARLPGLAAALLEEWELAADGPARPGHASLVLPVRTGAGLAAALKIGWDGDEETEHEALALQRWGGRGAVRLLRADPHRRAVLLERLHPEDLGDHWDLEACEIVAGLYGRLHVPAPPQLRTVASYVERRVAPLAGLPRDAPVPRRLVEQARALARDLSAPYDGDGRLVHGDLHYATVLAGDREPWLAVDPRPRSGDPHYEPAPMLWNRWEELLAGGDLRDALRRRFHTLVDVAGLDEDRARGWVVVRMVLDAHATIEAAAGRALDAGERERITRCVTIAKAVQD